MLSFLHVLKNLVWLEKDETVWTSYTLKLRRSDPVVLTKRFTTHKVKLCCFSFDLRLLPVVIIKSHNSICLAWGFVDIHSGAKKGPLFENSRPQCSQATCPADAQPISQSRARFSSIL